MWNSIKIQMGITIHYKGKIDKVETIGKMTDELADISTSLKWKQTAVDDAEQEVKGIVIKPHENSESLSILVNRELHLISFFALSLNEANKESARFVSIKTQYAPIHIHVSMIKLLKYLKNKYVTNLEVVDEGDYWNTMDEKILKEKMDFLATRIDLFGDILDTHQEELQEAETAEKVAEKIEEIMKKFGFNLK